MGEAEVLSRLTLQLDWLKFRGCRRYRRTVPLEDRAGGIRLVRRPVAGGHPALDILTGRNAVLSAAGAIQLWRMSVF